VANRKLGNIMANIIVNAYQKVVSFWPPWHFPFSLAFTFTLLAKSQLDNLSLDLCFLVIIMHAWIFYNRNVTAIIVMSSLPCAASFSTYLATSNTFSIFSFQSKRPLKLPYC
jgi:hypothetical protein